MGCSLFRSEICLLIFKKFILRSHRHEVVERGDVLAVSSKKTRSSFFVFYVFLFLFAFWFLVLGLSVSRFSACVECIEHLLYTPAFDNGTGCPFVPSTPV